MSESDRAELTALQTALGLAVMSSACAEKLTGGDVQELHENLLVALSRLPVEQRMEAMGMVERPWGYPVTALTPRPLFMERDADA